MYFGTPPIVTNGLVLNLDAANRMSYPGSGNTWFDLSGMNNNATLITGSYSNVNGGAFVLDGVSRCISLGNPASLTVGANPFSIEYVLTTTNAGGFIFSKDLSGVPQNQFRSQFNASKIIYILSNSNNTDSLYSTDYTLATTFSITGNIIYHVCVTRSGTLYNMYINGVRNITASTSTIINHSNSTEYVIGARSVAGGGYTGFMSGNIYLFRQYNIELSPEQVLRNFESTKSRFNLS